MTTSLHRSGGTVEFLQADDEVVSEADCRAIAALPSLGAYEFEQLTGYRMSAAGSDDLFIFDQKGVRSREYSDHELALLDPGSRSEVMETVRHNLDFPCTPAELVQFVDAVSWFFDLPDGFRNQAFPHGQDVKDHEYPDGSITVHDSKRRRHTLDHELDVAIKKHGLKNDAVWSALTLAAEQNDKEYPALVGVVADGVQYRGRRYEETGEPDVFTKKQCRERLRKRQRKLGTTRHP